MTREDREAYQLGRERFERGDVDGALLGLSELQSRYPRYADVHYMVGILHERRGDLPAAAESLERALAVNPQYSEAALALLHIYEQQGQHERSRRLSEALHGTVGTGRVDGVTAGKLANLQAALGDAYREAGEPREAVEAYRKALDRCPRFHDIRQRLGIALREAGLPDRAMAEFRRVLRANPDYVEARVQLGVTLYSLGRTAEAREEWREALAQEPGCDAARMYLRLAPEPGAE